MIVAENLVYHIQGRRLTDDVSLTLPDGEIIAILGPNGAGKSTLLRQLTGYLQPHSGRCSLFGKPLNEWSITELAKTRAVRDYRHLSGGEQQRVQLARLLVQLWEPEPRPKWLFLDEPTSALDIHHQQHLFRLLRRLVGERQFSVCCVLHDLNLAARYADRVVLMERGRIVDNGRPQDVLQQSSLNALYGADLTVMNEPEHRTPLIVLNQ